MGGFAIVPVLLMGCFIATALFFKTWCFLLLYSRFVLHSSASTPMVFPLSLEDFLPSEHALFGF